MMSDISSLLITASDRAYLLSELDSIQRSFFSAQGSRDLNVLGIRSSSLPFWTNFLASGEKNAATLESMRQEIQNYRLIRVTIAFEPDRSFLEKMITVFRKSVGENCLLSVEVVTSLAAGVIYTVDGKIIDLSLAKKISEIDLHPILHKYMPVLSSS